MKRNLFDIYYDDAADTMELKYHVEPIPGTDGPDFVAWRESGTVVVETIDEQIRLIDVTIEQAVILFAAVLGMKEAATEG